MKKIGLVFCFCILLSGPSCDQKPKQQTNVNVSDQSETRVLRTLKDSTTLTVETHGPFVIGNLKRIKIWVHVGRVHFHTQQAKPYPESDVYYAVVDTASNVLLRRNFPADGYFEMSFDFSQEEIPRLGSVLICSREVVPSAPGSGRDCQMLGLNSIEQIVSLTGVIGTESFKLVFLNTSKGPIPVDANDPLARPFVESEYWTGNFTALFYHAVYPDGITYDDAGGAFNFQRIPVRIDSNDARQWREREKGRAKTIRLFLSPDADQSTPQILEVLPQSSIQFLDAVYRNHWWLHIIVDGSDGFVSPEDFDTIGLPAAG